MAGKETAVNDKVGRCGEEGTGKMRNRGIGILRAVTCEAGRFHAGKSEAGKSEAGKFEAGKFEAGKFEAGKFHAGKFHAGRFRVIGAAG